MIIFFLCGVFFFNPAESGTGFLLKQDWLNSPPLATLVVKDTMDTPLLAAESFIVF